MMHQHMQHDIFGHAAGEIADRDANQRHLRQARIRHQRVDAGAEIEDHAQVRKRRELARRRLPDRGVVDLGGIERRIGQQHHAPVAADLVEPAASSAPATSFRSRHASAERARLCSSDFRLIMRNRAEHLPADACRAKYFRYPVGSGHTRSSSDQTGTFRMLYAILCYHDEDFVGSWTKEQDAAVMKKLAVVQDKLTKAGPARAGGAAVADDVGDHAAQGRSAARDRRPLCRDQGTIARLLCRRLQESRRGARRRARSRRGQSRRRL